MPPVRTREEIVISDNADFAIVKQELKSRGARTDIVTVTTSAGTKIGTSATQLIGFWGATAVAQHSSNGQVSGFVAGSGAAALVDSTHTGGVGSEAYTVGDVVRALKLAGIMAS